MFDPSVRKIDNISKSTPQDNAFPSKVAAMHDSPFVDETKFLVDGYIM